MSDRLEKYNRFVENDINSNKGRLVNACDELEYLLNHPNANAILSRHYLNDILTYATHFSEFYKQYRGYTDLSDFPILKKQDLKDNWKSIIVKEYLDDPECVTKFTSGSTGTPFEMFMDKYKHCRWIAGNKIFRKIDGVESHEKTFFISTNVIDKNIPLDRQERDNVYYISFPYRSDEHFQRLLERIMLEDVRSVTAIASFYNNLADFIRRGKAPKWNGDLIAVFTMSEHIIESTRKTISAYFKCPMYDYYANEENGAFGMEDGSDNGRIANTVDYYFEVLSLDDNTPVSDGEVGRLVITDFFNKAFPIIRYENGDLVSMKHMDDGRVYFTQVLGRVTDTLYNTKGTIVDFFHAISFLEPLTDIKQFQLIQNNYDSFRWVLNTENHSYEDFIIHECKKLFGTESKFEFEYVDDIPRLRSGKYRMTVCNIPDKKNDEGCLYKNDHE